MLPTMIWWNNSSLLSLRWLRLRRRSRLPGFDDRRTSVFRSGRNVWRIAHAKKATVLIDADAFFRSFAEAAARVEKQLIIIGWDTDSRTELPRPEGFDVEGLAREDRLKLGIFLAELATQRPGLRIHVLSWDFAFIYLLERETLPGVKFSSLGNERIRFVLDARTPFWASHHQKIVVIDDQVAFSGGLDITQRRWDTREHRGYDPRRVDPEGRTYGPFHDVQLCVEGDVASELGAIARERWRLATGERLEPCEPPCEPPCESPWPPGLAADFQDVDIGIARTEPFGSFAGENPESDFRSSQPSPSKPMKSMKPVKEVERLFLDTIRSARWFIYVENQYFTSPVIARALGRRLSERHGPEIVMILPRDQTGWIEESTMGLLRSEAIRMVRACDRFGRFRCFYPVVPNLGQGYIKVHSKVMIIDDVFLRVGSANLNSRSMGLDTECDLALEAGEREDSRRAIERIRCELLSEHLGVTPEEFAARHARMGSLLKTVESFCGGERGLIEIPLVPEWVKKVAPPAEWLDPIGPKGIRRWIVKRLALNRGFLAGALILGVTLGLLALAESERRGYFAIRADRIPNVVDGLKAAYAWLRSWDEQRIAALLTGVRGTPAAIPYILIGFVVGSFLFIPITAMILGVAIAYPRSEAIVLALGGTMVAALATYGLGRYWAWTKSRFLARPFIQKISTQMNRGGVWAIALVRLTPIAPFTAVSIVAGGLRVRLRDYMLGTFIGLLPGSLALTLLSNEAAQAAGQADWGRVLAVMLVALVFFACLPFIVRRLRRAL